MSVQHTIEAKLRAAYQPSYLAVIDESYKHNVPHGAESHFRVTLVANVFTDEKLVRRHRGVYKVLSDELAGPVHALALHTYAPQEWHARDADSPGSPPCLGGG
jgi:BolA protein